MSADAAARRRRVVIVYKSLPHYRVEFYSRLRARLAAAGVDLTLVYGQASAAEATRADEADLDWAEKVHNRFFRIGRRELVWQPCVGRAREADLVIVEQASRLLVNYVLLLLQAAGAARVAFWGHGANLQRHTAHRAGEYVKRVASRFPHWWFAYTEGAKRRVVALGYPPERVTVVQNAIDTTELAALAAGVTDAEVAAFRQRLSLGGGPVGIFVGGLYAEKRLPFLFDAADRLHAQLPDFRLIVVGSGPDRPAVERAVATRSYARYLGPLFGREKAVALKSSAVFLMPGLVGLAVLDAFAAELPLVTTAVDFHSPEIEYLRDGDNGILVERAEDPAAYAGAVSAVLENSTLRERLVAGCRRDAAIYTVAAMAERFADGVLTALDAGRRSRLARAGSSDERLERAAPGATT